MPLFVPGERLGGTELAAGAVNTAIVGPFAPYKYLTIYACVSGYASGGIFSLRFGSGTTAAVDSATTSYSSTNLPSTTTTAATAFGTSVVLNSQTMMRLADAQITTGRMATIEVMNRSNTLHTCSWVTSNEGAVTGGQKVILGRGTYATGAASQITCVQLISDGGNLNTGTGFAVYGRSQL